MADDIEVGTLRAKIETDDTGIAGTLDGLTRQLKVVQSEFAATSAKLGAFATTEETAKVKADSLTQQIDIQGQKVAILSAKHAESAANVGESARATQKLQIVLNNAQAALSGMENQLTTTTAALELNSEGFNKVSEAAEKAAIEEKTFSTSMKEAKEGIELTHTAMLGLGVVMAGGMLAEWAEGSEKLAISLQKIQIETGNSAQSVERLAVVSSGAGVSTDQLATMVGKLDLRVGTATLSTKSFMTALDTLGINAQKFGEANLPEQANMIAEAIQHSIVPAKELNGALKSIGLTAQTTGGGVKYSLDIISGALAKTSQEGSTLGRTLTQAGIDMNTFAAADVETKLQILGKYFEDTQDKAKATALVMTVFGKSGQDMLPLIQNFSELDQYAKNLKMPVMDTREIQLAAEKTKMLQTAMQMMMDSALVKILPVIDSIAKAFYDLAADISHPLTAISDFEKELGLFPAIITGIVAAFATMKIVTSVIATISAFTEAIKAATKVQWLFNAALDANPIGLVVIGIAALTAAGVLLYENWDKLSTKAKVFIGMAAPVLGFMEVGIALYKNWDIIGIRLEQAWQGITYAFMTAMNFIKQLFISSILSWVTTLSEFTKFIPGLGTEVDKLKTSITNMAKAAENTQSLRDHEYQLKQHALSAEADALAIGKVNDAINKLGGVGSKPYGPSLYNAEGGIGSSSYEPTAPPVAGITAGSGGTIKTPEQLRKEAYDAALATAKFNAQFLNQSVADQIAALNKVAAAHKQHLAEDIGDQRAMQLDVKKLNEDAVTQAQAADHAKFEFSKQWIADKKELNQLSATQEIAAWKRVSDQYGAGTAEKIEADKNYYSLKAALDKQAAADKIALDKKTHDDAVSAANDLGSAIETALKAQYAEEQRIEVAANATSLTNEQNASNDRLAVYQTEHDQRITLLDDTTNAQVAALQAQMDAIDAQTKAEDAATKEAAYQAQLVADQTAVNAIDNSKQIADAKQKLIDATQQQQFRTIDAQAEYQDSVKNSPDNQVEAQRILNQKLLGLSQDVATAQSQLDAQTTTDNTAKATAQKSLADLVAQHDRDILLAQRDAQKTALQQQITAIQAAEVAAKTSIDNELKAKQTAETNSLKATTERLAKEKTAIDEHYAALTTTDALAAKARTLALDTNNKELITLLSTYNPQWQNAGQSFGDSLLAGLNSTKASIQTAVNDILSLVNQSKTVEVGKNVTQGLAQGVGAALPALKQSSGGVIGAMVDVFKNTLGIRSPSRVMMEIGNFTGQGMVLGLQGTINNIRQQARLLATAAIPQGSGLSFAGGASGASSGGGGGSPIHYNFAPNSVVINAKDIKDIQDIINVFNCLPQASRAR